MASIGDLNIRLGIQLKAFEKGLSKAERKLKRFSRKTAEIGDSFLQNISLPILAMGGAALKATGNFEQLEKGLESIMGDSVAAKKEMQLLKKEALKPGLDLTQALKGSVRLQSVKIDAELAREALANFGNAIALAGGTSADLDGITLALTQIKAKGKISAEEINQLAERAPQVRQAIQDAFGTSDSEQLQKMGVSVEEFIDKVVHEMGKLPQATSGLNNAFNNTQQAVTKFLVAIGNDINQTFNVTERIEKFGNWLGELSDRFSNLEKSQKKTILKTALFAASVGPVIKVVSLFTQTVGNAISLTKLFATNIKNLGSSVLAAAANFKKMDTAMKATTIGAIVAVVGLATAAYMKWSNSMTTAQRVQQTLADVSAEAQKNIAQEKVEIDLLRRVINDETASREDKKKAIENLQRIAPDYFRGLDVERNSIDEINNSLDGYIARLLKKAKHQAAMEKIIELEKELLDLASNGDKLKPGVFQTISSSFNSMGNAAQFALLQAEKVGENFTDSQAQIRAQIEALKKSLEEIPEEVNVSVKISSNRTFQRTSTGGKKEKTQAENDLEQFESDREKVLRSKMKDTEGRIDGIIRKSKEAGKGVFKLDAELLESINESADLLDPASEKALKMAEAMQTVKNTALLMGDTMYQASLKGASSFKELGKAALSAAADVVRAKIMEGVTSYVTQVLQSSPLGIFLAPAAGAAAGVMFNKLIKSIKIPAFEKGVRGFGGGMALVGEAGPELVNLPRGSDVIPNNRLGGASGGSIHVTGRLVGSGNQLIAVIDEATRQRNRLGV